MGESAMKHKYTITFLVWIAVLSLLPLLMQSDYDQHLCVTALIYILMAQGLNICLGYCGQMSLGQAGFYAIGGYVFAICVQKSGIPWFGAVLIAIALTTVAGLLLGMISLRVRGSSFIIISILFARVVHMILLNWVEITNGQAGITALPGIPLFGTTLVSKTSIYYYVLFFVVVLQFLTGRLKLFGTTGIAGGFLYTKILCMHVSCRGFFNSSVPYDKIRRRPPRSSGGWACL